MAHIRTIKPTFFSSADIVGLSCWARLLYIALWCESDREGRMNWRPQTFKLRYFPADDIDIEAVCDELVNAGLVLPYASGGKAFAEIPTFNNHQSINARERSSVIPENFRDASGRVNDASLGRKEGRKEGRNTLSTLSSARESKSTSGRAAESPLPDDLDRLHQAFEANARKKGLSADASRQSFDRFIDHAKARGKLSADWEAEVRLWLSNERNNGSGYASQQNPSGERPRRKSTTARVVDACLDDIQGGP